MLVCSVSQRPRNATLAADLIETATAIDNPATAIVVGTLVDSPGNATDIVDAFVGQQIVEAANATVTQSVAVAYKISIVEETTAISAVDNVPKKVINVTHLEAATATATQDVVTPARAAVAVLEGAFVDPQAPATVVGTDVLDSGPITVLN